MDFVLLRSYLENNESSEGVKYEIVFTADLREAATKAPGSDASGMGAEVGAVAGVAIS